MVPNVFELLKSEFQIKATYSVSKRVNFFFSGHLHAACRFQLRYTIPSDTIAVASSVLQFDFMIKEHNFKVCSIF